MPRRFIDRPDELQIPLERRNDQAAYITQAVRRHHLPARLSQLEAKGTYVPAPPKNSQGVVVKLWPASPSTTASHLRYLERGKGVDGTDASLFTDENRTLNRSAFLTQAQQDGHQHRLIISLATDAQVDLRRFTQTVMRQMEFDLKTPLVWVAAVHYDTAHPHAHVVIRGRDVHGKGLYFQKQYWSHGLRHRVMQMATKWLGPVTKAQETERLDMTMTDHMWQSRKPQQTKTMEVALPSQAMPQRPRILTPQEQRQRVAEADARVERLRQALAQRGRGKSTQKEHEQE
jgi:type IV secretory pathway VirD2 relaxase